MKIVLVGGEPVINPDGSPLRSDDHRVIQCYRCGRYMTIKTYLICGCARKVVSDEIPDDGTS